MWEATIEGRTCWLGEAQYALTAAFEVNLARVSEVLSGRKIPEARALALNGRAV
jgi:hypothetical protein